MERGTPTRIDGEHAHRAGLAGAIAPRVCDEVVEDLVQMRAVDAERRPRRDFDAENVPFRAAAERRLLDHCGDERRKDERLGQRFLAPAERQHVAHHAFDAPRVVVDDAHQPDLDVGALFLGQQFGRLHHGRQRVADLVRHARSQATERGELHLLHALQDLFEIGQVDQRVAIAPAILAGAHGAAAQQLAGCAHPLQRAVSAAAADAAI